MKRWLAAAIAATAAPGASCLSIPPFTPTELVKYNQDGSGALVTSTKSNFTSVNFALHFAGGSGFHFPDELYIGSSANLLGHNAMAACYDVSGTGLAIYPTSRISTDGDAQPMQDDLTRTLSGPAVMQMQLQWSTQLGCNPRRAPGGTSTFTVFPNGRIVRHDTLNDSSQEIISPGDCACQTTDRLEFDVSSYWTFARAFQTLFTPGDLVGTDLQDLPSSEQGDVACFDAKSYQVASAWVNPMSSGNLSTIIVGPQMLIHRLQQPLGFQDLMLPWEVHGALFLGTNGCTMAIQRATAYTNPPNVAIDGMPVPFSPLDGIYGSDPGGDNSKSGVLLPGGHGTLKADAAPFAVWLRFPDPVDGVYATAADETGPWYTPQQFNDRSWIVWFQDPLAAGKTINLEPL